MKRHPVSKNGLKVSNASVKQLPIPNIKNGKRMHAMAFPPVRAFVFRIFPQYLHFLHYVIVSRELLFITGYRNCKAASQSGEALHLKLAPVSDG
jgi:hypothetical protein